jgi:copper chaperone NosL
MIISDEPFAAAAVIASSDGVRKVAFDDIGCLLDFLREAPRGARVTSYVHDYETREWIDAAQAVFVRSESLQTPMASNLGACKSRAAAAALVQRFPGVMSGFAELRAAAGVSAGDDRASTERSAP